MVRPKIIFRIPEPNHELSERLIHWLYPALGCLSISAEIVSQLTTKGWNSDDSNLPPMQLAALTILLEELFEVGGVVACIFLEQSELLTARRYNPNPFWCAETYADSELVMSPDSAIIIRNPGVTLESVSSGLSINLLECSLLPYISSFQKPCTIEQAQQYAPSEFTDIAPNVIDFLVRQGFLTSPEQSKSFIGSTLQWHEQLFYSKTRIKTRRQPALNQSDKYAYPEATTGVCVPPGAAAIPLHELVCRRKSSSHYSRRLTGAELAILMQSTMNPWSADPAFSKVSLPYPSSGGLRSLKFRCLVFDVENVSPGVYILSGAELVQMSSSCHSALRAVAIELQQSLLQNNEWRPQALILLEGVVEQASIKYPGLALSLLLREAGACLEFIHLLGVAMSLSICAVGVVSNSLLDVVDRPCPPNTVRLMEIAIGGG